MPYVKEDVQESVERFFATPHDRPLKCLLMITVYLDESEHSTASKYMAVAGFYGNDKQWTSFALEWKHALGSRKALHMNTLRRSTGRTTFPSKSRSPGPHRKK